MDAKITVIPLEECVDTLVSQGYLVVPPGAAGNLRDEEIAAHTLGVRVMQYVVAFFILLVLYFILRNAWTVGRKYLRAKEAMKTR